MAHFKDDKYDHFPSCKMVVFHFAKRIFYQRVSQLNPHFKSLWSHHEFAVHYWFSSHSITGWWFGTFFFFYDFPYIGNNKPIWRTHIFQRRGERPPTRLNILNHHHHHHHHHNIYIYVYVYILLENPISSQHFSHFTSQDTTSLRAYLKPGEKKRQRMVPVIQLIDPQVPRLCWK